MNLNSEYLSRTPQDPYGAYDLDGNRYLVFSDREYQALLKRILVSIFCNGH